VHAGGFYVKTIRAAKVLTLKQNCYKRWFLYQFLQSCHLCMGGKFVFVKVRFPILALTLLVLWLKITPTY